MMIRATGGSVSDPKLAYDNLSLQVLVRGKADSLVATQVAAQGVYDALHGFRGEPFIVGGITVVLCAGMQGGPAYIGTDGNGRHEYSLNFRLTVKNDSRRT
jgi:hypothetical protein